MSTPTQRGALSARNVAQGEVIVTGTSHVTPGTVVDANIGDVYDGGSGGISALSDAELLAVAQRDLDIIDTAGTATVPGAFAFSSAVAATGVVRVVCSVASRAFAIVPR